MSIYSTRTNVILPYACKTVRNFWIIPACKCSNQRNLQRFWLSVYKNVSLKLKVMFTQTPCQWSWQSGIKNSSANTFYCNQYTASPALGNAANSSLQWPICLDLLLVVGILRVKNLNIKIDTQQLAEYNERCQTIQHHIPKWPFTLKYENRRRVESVFIIHADFCTVIDRQKNIDVE